MCTHSLASDPGLTSDQIADAVSSTPRTIRVAVAPADAAA